MASEHYLKILKEAGVHDVRYLSSQHSKDSLMFASIISTKEIKEPFGGRSDFMLSFYISDPSIFPGSVNTCIFSNKREPLELIKNADIIVIENFHLKTFNDQPQFSINRFSRFATYKSKSLTCTFNKSYDAGPFDEKILKALDAFDIEQKQARGHKVAVPTPRSILETAQIEDDKSKFFDYVGQVIDLTFENERVTITLTDYTLNPKPITHTVDESIVRKDYMIMCTVWDSLVDQCANLAPGDYVYLKNCVKKNSHPLEFSIRNKEDRGKMIIKKIEVNDPRLITLIQRKTKYSVTKEKKRKRDQSFPPLSTGIHIFYLVSNIE
ncbi:hypothetical protein BD770DRAFT_177077 [Pilaira anomala]|nr:hypothetical protein BD770DRAFT_177077 [Pilaira anomala]